MSALVDITGKKYGRLTVINRAYSCPGEKTKWFCVCECGETKVILGDSLRTGKTRSCGCFRREKISCLYSTHRQSKTRLYKIWLNMRGRCNNPNRKSFENYGGRGISICTEWDDFENFQDWALSAGYSNDLSIERIDVNGNYGPGNCTWIPKEKQARNTRKTVRIKFAGENRPLFEWCDLFDISYDAARKRINAGNHPFKPEEIYISTRRNK